MEYACLTSDIVASRALPDRAAVQARVEGALADANARFAAELRVPFAITVGDEWQGLLGDPAAALEVAFHIADLLHPIAIASGIGIGEIATGLRERTALMDGPCFHRARAGLDDARKIRGSATVVRSEAERLDVPANAILRLLHAISERWTPRQLETVRAYQRHATEAAAASSLGVSQPTVHQSLDRSLAKPYLEARTALVKLARSFAGGK
jgi:hypothetical protein